MTIVHESRRARIIRSTKVILVALTAVFAMAIAGVGPAIAADAVAGKALALQWCSSCHLVADDQTTASSTSLPSFYDIAKDPGWSEETLATFLADPHPKMPNMSLKTVEISNLARYITSLEP